MLLNIMAKRLLHLIFPLCKSTSAFYYNIGENVPCLVLILKLINYINFVIEVYVVVQDMYSMLISQHCFFEALTCGNGNEN